MYLRVFIMLSETYELRDLNFYDSMTSNNHHWDTTSEPNVTFSINDYSSNGWKFGQASHYFRFICDYTPSKPFTMEFEVTEMNPSYTVAIFVTSNHYINFAQNECKLNDSSVFRGSVIGKYVLKVYNGYMELYKDGTRLGQINISENIIIQLECGSQSNRYIRLKDFIIQEL